jgi:hypothetical protein
MGIQGVTLEDHRHIAMLGFHCSHIGAIDQDGSGTRLVQTSDHAQSRGFTAAGGSEQD